MTQIEIKHSEIFDEFKGKVAICPNCNSGHIIKKGYYLSEKYLHKIQRLNCIDCGHRFHGIPKIMETEEEFKYKSKIECPTQQWDKYTEGQQNERKLLPDVLDELFQNIQLKYDETKKGRHFHSIKDITYCLMLKTYTKLSSRRLNSDLESIKKEGYIEKVPNFTTMMKYLNKEELTWLLDALITLSSKPIPNIKDVAIDSSGFSTSQFGRWFDFKYDKDKTIRKWIKAHIVCDTQTNIITSAIVTSGNLADSPQLKPLLEKNTHQLREVSADRAYSSRENLQIITNMGAVPYIPFKSNVTGAHGKFHIWKKSYRYFKENPQEFFEHYHKRSNVETCFHMIKQKFGKDLATKSFESQRNEILLKVLCHNICCLIQEYYLRNIESYYSTQVQKIQVLIN